MRRRFVGEGAQIMQVALASLPGGNDLAVAVSPPISLLGLQHGCESVVGVTDAAGDVAQFRVNAPLG
jgi:hypothetical protein